MSHKPRRQDDDEEEISEGDRECVTTSASESRTKAEARAAEEWIAWLNAFERELDRLAAKYRVDPQAHSGST